MKLCNEKQKKSEKKITASLSRDKRSADTSTGLSGKISGSQEPAMPHPDKHPEEKVLPSSAVRRPGPVTHWSLRPTSMHRICQLADPFRNFSTFIARNGFVVYNQTIMSKIYG